MDPWNCNIEFCINNRDGTKQLYLQPVGKTEDSSDLKTIVSSLQKIQKIVNAELTVIVTVEKEKACAISTDNGTKTTSRENDIDEELEEDDEDDEINGLPVMKKIKR